jgi:hypothetical protein
MENMRDLAMNSMGWEGDSDATFQSRYWGPSRPVVHAAAAYLLLAKEFLWPVYIVMFYNFIWSSELLRKVVLWSEILRKEMSRVAELKINEDDTIQFLPE